MAATAADKAKLLKAGFTKQVLSDLSGMIRDKQYKRELVNLLNKYIEHQHKDKMPRIPVTITNMELADKVNKFIALHNTAFNDDLGTLIHRYMKQNYSSANGFAYREFLNFDQVRESINFASHSSFRADGALKENEDIIKLSLINKGIEKTDITRRPWILPLVVIIIGGIIIYLLVKSNNKQFKAIDDLSIDVPGDPISGMPASDSLDLVE